MPPPTPVPRALLITSVQDAIDQLLQVHEPEFIQFGFKLFAAFATILIAWQGVRMMFTIERGLGDHMFRFAELLLFISFGYAMIAFYESPLPGVGVSFSNLITNQTHWFAQILDANAMEHIFAHLDTLFRKFMQPSPWAILANFLFGLIVFVTVLAKVLMLTVVTFSLIATAVCGLIGPLCVPFFIVPKLDWIFWSWFKSLLQYSFVEVVAYAFMRIFERFLYRYLTVAVPLDGLTEGQYLTIGLQAVVVIGTLCLGMLLVPSLTSSIFSGRAGESVLPTRIRI